MYLIGLLANNNDLKDTPGELPGEQEYDILACISNLLDHRRSTPPLFALHQLQGTVERFIRSDGLRQLTLILRKSMPEMVFSLISHILLVYGLSHPTEAELLYTGTKNTTHIHSLALPITNTRLWHSRIRRKCCGSV